MNRSILALVLALGGCIETVRFGDDRLAGLTAISIEPAETTVMITDLAQAPTAIQFSAVGTFDDGTTRDVTSLVGWGVDNRAPGAFVGSGRYETSREAGGHVTVRAVAGGLEATARVDVIVTLSIVDSVFPPPLGAEQAFAPGTPTITDANAPTLLYPARGTKFPLDLARILFQLARGRTTHDAFRLRFDSDVLHLTVLTGSDRWQPDSAIWTLISRSHPGTDVQLVVEAVTTAAPGTIDASENVPLSFSSQPPGGAIYYWSGATNSVMRTTPSATTATKLYPADPDTTCSGCHAISRDGSKMAVGYNGEKLQLVSLGELATIPTAATGKPMGWATFSPTGDLVLVADKGTLTLFDATTGAPVGPDGGRVPLTTKATHPDWSPDGSYVAVALSGDVANIDVKAASIARIPFSAGTWGQPEVLVAAASDNNYFPRWSPDGKFIAYVRATQASRGAASAELRLIRADGGAPLPLALANQRVGASDGVVDLANTMPAWAPGSDEVAWLAFASTRPYGAVRPADGPSQIWLSALDLTRADSGLDPSFPALWLPSQDIRVLDNSPVWAVEPIRTE